MSTIKGGMLRQSCKLLYSLWRETQHNGGTAVCTGLLAGVLAALAVAGLPARAAQSGATETQVYFQHRGGLVESWTLTNGSYAATSVIGHFGAWQLKAAGDIDGDGVGDLVFQPTCASTAILFMNPQGTVRSMVDVGCTLPYGEVRACADYEGIGSPQLFYQTADTKGTVTYCEMSAGGNFNSSTVLGDMGAWQLRGAGDIDQDGKAELVWQDPAGNVSVWLHNADGSINAVMPFGSLGTWVLRGMFDLDGDGVSDLLWQNPDGSTAAWFINSDCTVRATSLLGPTGNWVIKAAGR